MSTTQFANGHRQNPMSPVRLFIDGPLSAPAELEILDGKARYVSRVLRLRPNDELTLFNGRGGEYNGKIASIDKQSVRIHLSEFVNLDAESPLAIHLLQGISRGERMDLVIQKATELGVSRITPLITEYSVVKLDPARAAKKHAHWQGIGASACEQCGRNVLPIFDQPMLLRNWIGANLSAANKRIILMPGARENLRSCLIEEREITVLIGPEGGFSEEEYGLAVDSGFAAISLGPRILRTETAALAVLAGLQTLFGDLAAN